MQLPYFSSKYVAKFSNSFSRPIECNFLPFSDVKSSHSSGQSGK